MIKTYLVTYVIKRNRKEYPYEMTITAMNLKQARNVFERKYYTGVSRCVGDYPHPFRIKIKLVKGDA